MAGGQQDILRLQPHMIPAMRAAVGTAVDDVGKSIINLNRFGYLSEPWLGDETSQNVADHYTAAAMDGSGSSYQALVAYHATLRRVHDTLQQMETNYRLTEGENAALWGRMA